MSEWPIEDNGRAFKPLPETWLDHPKAQDSGADGPRCLAVSVYLNGGRIIRVRYAHPVSGNVMETFGSATSNPDGDGYVPVGLVDGSGWARSFVPSPGEPHDTIRSCERDHLQSLWADCVDELDWGYERDALELDPEQRLIADGGQDIREWIRERIDTHIDLEDPSDQTNAWSSKYHVRQDIQYHQFGRQEVVDEIEAMISEGELIGWIGYVAPRESENLQAIIKAERHSEIPRTILIGECNKALQEIDANEEPTALTDGGTETTEIETVGDLDPNRTVHYATQSGGNSSTIHLDENCRHAEKVHSLHTNPARVLPTNRPVCRECVGPVPRGISPGEDPSARRKKLLDLEPDEVGLSAIGERGGQDV